MSGGSAGGRTASGKTFRGRTIVEGNTHDSIHGKQESVPACTGAGDYEDSARDSSLRDCGRLDSRITSLQKRSMWSNRIGRGVGGSVPQERWRDDTCTPLP